MAGVPVMDLLALAQIAGYFAAVDIFVQAKALYRVDIADIVNKAAVDSAVDSKPAVVARCMSRIALDFLVSLALVPMVGCIPQNLAVHPIADSSALVELVEDTVGALAALAVAQLAALAPMVVDRFADKIDLVVALEEVA